MVGVGEADSQRQAAIWGMLEATEVELCEQFNAFVLEFAEVAEPQARVSKLWLALPYATRWMPALTFDGAKCWVFTPMP